MTGGDGTLAAKMFDPVISEADGVRPTFAEVDLDRITANYRAIAGAVAPATVMPILKANAYGHGLLRIAEHLTTLGVEQFGVAYLEEALLLRHHGIGTPLLVLGGVAGYQLPLFLEHDVGITASSVDKLREIDRAAADLGRRARVHLKIDTGMGRIGTQYYSAATLFSASLEAAHCDVEAVYSHFARADEADLDSAKIQIERFEAALDFFPAHGLPLPARHMANSGAILQLPQSYYDTVRAGILLYGVYPSAEVRRTIAVQPALSWKSTVVYFKVVKPGHAVSYGSTWEPAEMTRVVTVPVGYGDGYFLRLSNRGRVLIGGRSYPIVGRVCMDQFMVDIGWDSAYNGDEVVLLGASGDEGITAGDIAEWAETIPYEVLTNINTRVPRIYRGG